MRNLFQLALNIFFLILLCISIICCKHNTSNDLIVFDVNKNYPVKILDIQDIADIEYLILEVDNDYLFRDFDSMTDNFLICNGGEKDFLFFDRATGKPVSKISRYGQGPGEYILPVIRVYAEPQDEFFMIDHPIGIKVYGRDGTFKRQLPFDRYLYPSSQTALYDYNANYLLINCFSFKEEMKDTSFFLISKQDGVMESIYIPCKERVDLWADAVPPNAYFAVLNGHDYLLTDYSSDTVYRFTPDFELIPVLVRMPSITKMENKTLLHSWLETNNYLFFSTERLGFDWKKLERLQKKGFLMDKHSGQVFQANMQMRDYKGKELIIDPSVIAKTSNQQTGIIVLTAFELHQANEEKKLNGKLKEVTDRLTEDDEYIFMILNFK